MLHNYIEMKKKIPFQNFAVFRYFTIWLLDWCIAKLITNGDISGKTLDCQSRGCGIESQQRQTLISVVRLL